MLDAGIKIAISRGTRISRRAIKNRSATPARSVRWALLVLGGSLLCGAAEAANEAAARDLATASGCFKCHGVDKKKDGPALRDAAAKLRDLANAEEKLTFHVTSGEKVKFPDGHEEHHKKVKSTDPSAISNLVRWILALEGGTKD